MIFEENSDSIQYIKDFYNTFSTNTCIEPISISPDVIFVKKNQTETETVNTIPRKQSIKTVPRIVHENHYTCCGILFISKSGFKSHERHHSSKNFKIKKSIERSICDKCGKSYSRLQDLDRHINNVHLRKHVIQCEICHYVFSRSDAKKRHVDGFRCKFKI
jgi:uncharacterized C2H2 Zn-finger protein